MQASLSTTPADIHESQATGLTAEIFADIRQVQQSNNVNYIWRHLATIPDALETAWGRAKPRNAEIRAYGETIWAEAAALAATVVPTSAAPIAWPPAARAVLDSYARGNRWNLAALTLLLSGNLGPSVHLPPATASTPIPPLPSFDALPEDIRRAVMALANAGPAADTSIRPSLWVHLGLWPELLIELEGGLRPVLQSRAFHAAHAELLGICGAAQTNHVNMPAAAIPSLNRFRRRIAEMTLIGAASELI